MLNFNDTVRAFAYKSNKQIVKATRLFSLMNVAPLVKLGTVLTPLALKWKLPVKGLIRSTLFEQFVGGESLEQSSPVIDMLEKHHVDVILDYGVEGGEYNEEKYDHALEEFLKVIRFASTKKNAPFISVKLTGLTSFALLQKLNLSSYKTYEFITDEKMNEKLNSLFAHEKNAWQKLIQRTTKICETAQNLGVGVMIDAEESWIQDPIDYVALMMSRIFNTNNPVVYNTIQFYRHDRMQFMKDAHGDSIDKKYRFAIKIVRGAYMEKERARAAELDYPSPIHIDKKSVDADYNEAIQFCLGASNPVSLIVASHNEESTLLAVEYSTKIGRNPNDHNTLHFSQLYGMSDNITFNLAAEGFSVSKYLPFGPIHEVIPYLMRRAQENSSVSGQTNRELMLLRRESRRRCI